MKKIILLSAMTSAMLLATNGDIMIGDGAKSTGMGGVGIAVSHGSESLYANPAMIKDIKGSEFSGYVTMFQPNVNFKSQAGAFPAGTPTYEKSKADRSFIPGFAYVQRNNENIVWGISLAGTAGMGTDYKGAPLDGFGSSRAFGMQTELAIAKLSIPVAYTANNLTVAVAPVLQYSTLQINSQYQPAGPNTPFAYSNNQKESSVGLGMTAGLAYDIGALTLGAVYKSKIEAEYKDNIALQTTRFGMNLASGDKLDQPAEIGFGLGYKIGNSTIGLDVKRVQWSDAAGYQDFGWEDQTVLALGYQYETPSWTVRAGYNQGKSPISEQNGNTPNGAKINFFNLAGFPAIVEKHYTAGADYAINENFDMSVALVYSPEVTENFSTVGMTGPGTSASVTHSQKALTLGGTYKF